LLFINATITGIALRIILRVLQTQAISIGVSMNEELFARFNIPVQNTQQGVVVNAFLKLAATIDEFCTDSRAKSIALANLETAEMYAVKAINTQGE